MRLGIQKTNGRYRVVEIKHSGPPRRYRIVTICVCPMCQLRRQHIRRVLELRHEQEMLRRRAARLAAWSRLIIPAVFVAWIALVLVANLAFLL